MLIPIYDAQKTKTIKKMVEVTETVPMKIGAVNVYPVQYRNYPENKIHIQHAGYRVNREYGFAFNIPGQAGGDVVTRYLPSLAGTSPMYAHGALVVTDTSATLVGVNDRLYNVPLNTLPF